MGRGHWQSGLGLLAGFALSACSGLLTEPTPARPAPPVVVPVVAPTPVPVPLPPSPTASPEREALAVYYRQLERDQLARGLVRIDGGGPDTPYTSAMLARNFMAVALFDEYSTTGGALTARPTASPLRRWAGPIRMSVDTGPAAGTAQAATNAAIVTEFAARLSRLTGVSITQTSANPNFQVLFLNENERLAAETQIRAALPGISASALRYILTLPRDELCVVVTTFDGTGTTYSKALAIIRAEHPPLMAKACVHEELAQGMGLANDSPHARPSIFNDDEEFGYLTTHDELLLRMLYDPRLRPGMTAEQAEPIVRQIASDLVDPVT